MYKSFGAVLSSLFIMTSGAYAAATEVPTFRGAQIIKSEPVENAYIEVPLSKIYRSGRGWEPEQVELIEGTSYQTLYKIGRNVPLDAVNTFYRDAVMNINDNQILFECQSRACGSSNAWANNFFNDYLLYGADANQSLLVTKDASNHYWVLYINRRGAGDVMVRLDEVVPAGNDSNIDILAQLSATDIPRIRRALNDFGELTSVVGFVTSEAGDVNAVATGDRYIEAIRAGLNPAERESIRFINLANMGDPAYGSHRVIFVRIEKQ
ncbi:DUF4892 domain-containing protein [Marinomonas ostreistagni]|uniref:DUF4892 domain-containing protein n=1 Tax=Marinomonas ostreistagni TaxID=359209 RepID=UPI00194E4B03|nr:DUF4892 domain-containing protein [Marinomonas ostreistagni]MBM6550193.1 DUF4892 domain-containing protein [Marinomonas ostreistagni]